MVIIMKNTVSAVAVLSSAVAHRLRCVIGRLLRMREGILRVTGRLLRVRERVLRVTGRLLRVRERVLRVNGRLPRVSEGVLRIISRHLRAPPLLILFTGRSPVHYIIPIINQQTFKNNGNRFCKEKRP